MKKTGQNPLFLTLSNNSSNAFIKNLGEDGPGVAVSQTSPYPFSATIPIVKEFQDAISRNKDAVVSYASMEGFIAAKVLVEGLKRAGPKPTREKLITALESLRRFDLGGVDVTYGPGTRAGTSYIDITIVSKTGRFMR
jgi:ABC-type branched-subunit amino acid transport system substrate-binding protein